MESAPHIEFQGMEPSPEFRDKITHHLSRLEERFGRITACRVTVGAPSGHRHTGDPFEIKIFRNCPGAEGGLGQPERLDQGFRAVVQGFDDVPALLPCSGEEGADGREVVRALH